MTRLLLPAMALVTLSAIAAPALADQRAPTATPIAFARDGVAYVGTLRMRGETQLISGHEVDSGRPFELIVRRGRVSGTYDATPVSYTLAQK
ncbi:hypothetical protein [Sphingomonas bacterium]|uniref:hypothetical protein n=1 Tax=Sphingomonas bacterium TaxID=1895847 RepID=UPI001575E281|nr:hypothetical protein [Sphingomonas bacterium]